MYRTAIDIWSGKAKIKYGYECFYLKAKTLNPFSEGFLSFAISKHIGEQNCWHVHIVGTIHYRRVGRGGVDQWHFGEQTHGGSQPDPPRHLKKNVVNWVSFLDHRGFFFRKGLLDFLVRWFLNQNDGYMGKR